MLFEICIAKNSSAKIKHIMSIYYANTSASIGRQSISVLTVPYDTATVTSQTRCASAFIYHLNA